MKKLIKFTFLTMLIIGSIAACNNEEDNNVSVEGMYNGTLTQVNELKGADNDVNNSYVAHADVSKNGNREITVHCYGEGFDTTIVLNYFHDNDSIHVCMTGDDFYNHYGHMYGEGHMGNMMGDMDDDETEWMHHMADEHENGDQHYGGFSSNCHSFEYSFEMHDSQGNYYLRFYGEK